jgi:3-oxoacyl-[acyl-carrier-protein] synthase-3
VGFLHVFQKKNESNAELIFDEFYVNRLIKTIGIEQRRTASDDIYTSDLCFEAAEKMISDLTWLKFEIKLLIFVTQTSDFILPATSHILQARLGLSSEGICNEISEGCSGYVYGLYLISPTLSALKGGKEILVIGNTISKIISDKDKSIKPLFGDAGAATGLEYKLGENMYFDIGGDDGTSSQDIVIKECGFRNPIYENSLIEVEIGKGVTRAVNQLYLDGMNVFQLSISYAPNSVKNVLAALNKPIKAIDYAIFHQPNMFMNENIRKKLNLLQSQVQYSLK